MEEKMIMEELGFIITPSGKIFQFGEYKPFSLRDKENPHHYHTTAFQTEVASTEEWKNLGLPFDENTDINTSIATFASYGLIVGLNKTEGAFFASTPTILLVTPDHFTEEQLQILMAGKPTLTQFDTKLSYIRIIDTDGNTIDRPRYMTEFYEEHVLPYVDNLIQKRG